MKTSQMKLSDIIVEEPFKSFFPIHEDSLESIKIDMENNGYDEAFPVIVWEEKNIIVDGHTRFNVATELQIEDIPALLKNFENEDDAILYAFHLQRNRRNLSDEDILRCLHRLDVIKEAAVNKGVEPEVSKKESAEQRAKELGTTKSKIEKARKVIEHGSDDIKAAVDSGEKTINKAFNEMQDIRRGSGELKTGKLSTGLACSSRYNKALSKFTEEIKRIKDEEWQEVPKEKILLDLETIEALVG